MSRDLAYELAWLKAHPQFEERPPSLEEFLGPDYLGISGGIRAAIKECLVDIMGPEVNPDRMALYELAMITGAIGIGKTTIASIVLPYMACWTLCLKNPQEFYGLLPGSRIAFMQMSTSEDQAREVVFGDIEARIMHSKWFENYPRDPRIKKQIRFGKDVWIIPGDSAETTFEGYNILGGILDEADSHKVVRRVGAAGREDKDYAEVGYDTIRNRIQSRFGQRGFLLVIGQMKKAVGFAARKYKEFQKLPNAYVKKLTIWDSMGDDYYRCREIGPHPLGPETADGVLCREVHKFAYDMKRKIIVPLGAASLVSTENILWVPENYKLEFINNPEKALKDLAGVPPMVGDPFISLVDRIEECPKRWMTRYGLQSPVDERGRIAPWLQAQDTLKRVAHVDIGYAENGDALGISMGHVTEMVEIEEDGSIELKPYIVIDFIMRMTAPPGDEIFLGDMRRVLYELRYERKFRLKKVTLDGFQSQDTIQQLNKRRIEAEYLSIDRQKLPYEDLREAIYERRIDFPEYITYLNRGDSETVEIAVKELCELVDNGKKIDHPEGGSKDVADTLAGVVTTLMGDRRYRRATKQMDIPQLQQTQTGAGLPISHPAFLEGATLTAPVPPQNLLYRGGR